MEWQKIFVVNKIIGKTNVQSGFVYDTLSETGLGFENPSVFVSLNNANFSSGYMGIDAKSESLGNGKFKIVCDTTKSTSKPFTASGLTFTLNGIFGYTVNTYFKGFSDKGNFTYKVDVYENGVRVGEMSRTTYNQVYVPGNDYFVTEMDYTFSRSFSSSRNVTIELRVYQSGFWSASTQNKGGTYLTGEKVTRGGKANVFILENKQ